MSEASEAAPQAPVAAPATPPAEAASAPPAAVPAEPLSHRERALQILKGEVAAPTSAGQPEVPPKAEVTKFEDPAEKKKSDRFAQRFQALTEEQAKIRREKDSLKSQRAELDPIIKAKASKDPVAALQAMGFTFEQAVEQVLAGKPGDVPKALTQDDVEKLVAERVRSEVDSARAQAQQNAAMNQFLVSITETAAKEPEKFELIGQRGASQLVYDVVDAYYKETGELLGGTPAEARRIAMEQVEAVLEEEMDGWLKTNKAKRKVTSVAPETATPRPQATTGQSPKPPPKSLTNSLVSAAPPRPVNTRPSQAELREQALSILRKGAG